jgi:hypothetical protein
MPKGTYPIKKIELYGFDGTDLRQVKVDSEGRLQTTTVATAVISPSTNFYYNSDTKTEGTTLTTSYQQFSFGFTSTNILIVNDHASNYISFSFDGINEHGRILAGESVLFTGLGKSSIYLKGQAGGEGYRLWAW